MIMHEGDVFEGNYVADNMTYESFIKAFNDRNPLHTSLEFAKSKGFDKIVLHGNILNGFLSNFIGEILPIKDVMIISQSIDFHNPFHLNDEIYLKAKLVNLSNAVKTAEFKFVFRNQHSFKLAKGTIIIKLIE